MRNHGQSPHSSTFNYMVMAEDIHQFIKEHQLKNPILIGHSMGGKVAMQYALDYPEIIKKLVVIDISMRKYADRQQHINMITSMQQIDFSQVSTRQEIEDILIPLIPSKSIRLFVMKNLDRIDKKTFCWRLNLDAIYQNLDLIFEGVHHDEASDIPTLFVKGGKSDYIEDTDLPKIEKHFPNAQLKVIEDATHWVHTDAPETLYRMLNEFLSDS
ncbi:MAG: alpha/beta hydrolase [Clostridiales bacterium]|nr:MAG: alpha/beta hydrolase [Clostridiales bacterium]